MYSIYVHLMLERSDPNSTCCSRYYPHSLSLTSKTSHNENKRFDKVKKLVKVLKTLETGGTGIKQCTGCSNLR